MPGMQHKRESWHSFAWILCQEVIDACLAGKKKAEMEAPGTMAMGEGGRGRRNHKFQFWVGIAPILPISTVVLVQQTQAMHPTNGGRARHGTARPGREKRKCPYTHIHTVFSQPGRGITRTHASTPTVL